jgi:hypothetical protein
MLRLLYFLNPKPNEQNTMSNIPLVPFLRLRECEEPFVMHGRRWLFVTCLRADGFPDIGVYSFDTDLCRDYLAWREAFNLK